MATKIFSQLLYVEQPSIAADEVGTTLQGNWLIGDLPCASNRWRMDVGTSKPKTYALCANKVGRLMKDPNLNKPLPYRYLHVHVHHSKAKYK